MTGFVPLIALTACFGATRPPLKSDSRPTTVVRFASPDEGRTILTADDDFTASLSRFDLQCRLKTDDEVTAGRLEAIRRFGTFAPGSRAKSKRSRSRSSGSKKRLAGFRLPLPPVIRLVRTTGDEEANAAYTRAAAIVLPAKVMDDTPHAARPPAGPRAVSPAQPARRCHSRPSSTKSSALSCASPSICRRPSHRGESPIPMLPSSTARFPSPPRAEKRTPSPQCSTLQHEKVRRQTKAARSFNRFSSASSSSSSAAAAGSPS